MEKPEPFLDQITRERVTALRQDREHCQRQIDEHAARIQLIDRQLSAFVPPAAAAEPAPAA